MQVEVPEDGSDMHTLSLPSCALTLRDIQALCYGLSFASLTSLDLSSVALGTQAQHQSSSWQACRLLTHVKTCVLGQARLGHES